MMKIEVVEINTSPSLQSWRKARESPFVAFYDGNASTAVIFVPRAVDMGISCVWNMEELVGISRPIVAFHDGSVASTQEILPRNGQHLQHQPSRHVQLVGFKSFQDPEITYNEEFLSMARTLVLDYKEFLEDQLSSLLSLALLKRELSLSTAYNQMMVPEEVKAVSTLPSRPLYLTGFKKEEPPFVAFYDGIADTAVIFLPGDDYLKSSQNSLKKTEFETQGGLFVAHYNGVVATAQIFLPGAVEQINALTASPRSKVGIVKKRSPCVAFYEGSVATTSAVMPRNAQHLKHQPLTHVPLVGFGNIDDEFLSMARTMVLDYKDFLEDQLSSLLNLALLKRELSLSTAYNQTMLDTMDPDDLQSLAPLPSNQLYLARLPFIAFYDRIEATAVIFLPGHAKPLEPAPPTPLNSTRKESGQSRDIINNESGSSKVRVLLPYPQEVPTKVHPSKSRPPVRPQWSRAEKMSSAQRQTGRTSAEVHAPDDQIHHLQRGRNGHPVAYPQHHPRPEDCLPVSCLARSPLTPWYWLEDTYPDMVSASLKNLASQHMKYFRASQSRAQAQQTERSQIQVMEDLYWEDLRKMGAARISDDIYSRRQQESCLFNKVQFGSVIEGTTLLPEDKDRSCDKLPNNAKTAQLNYTACLNTNNNGYSREEGDCDVDSANSSVLGSKSDQGFSRGPDASRNKPRHSYLNKRHSDGHRSRNRKPTGAEGAYADYDKTCVEPEQGKANTAEDTGHLTDPTLQQCHSRNPKLTQIKDERTLGPIKSDRELSLESSAIHKDCTPKNDASQLNTVFQNDVQGEETTFKELFQDISNFNSLCDIPDSMKKSVLQLICSPFLSGGYNSGLCVLSNLIKSSLSSPGQAIQNQEQHVDQCGSSEGTAQVHTGRSIDSEEFNPVQVETDLWYREPSNMRSGKCTVIEDNPLKDDDFMGDLYFTDNSSDKRSESPHSYLHEDFSHDDDVLDIPSLSILSPSHDSLGQASHAISCPSTLQDDEIKLASNEPFPSEYVFKKACGPSFNVSSLFWHIQVPTLPSNMIHYQVEQDGLSEIVIGSGSFGEVYAATLTVFPGLSRDVVVKEPYTNKATLDSIVHEAKITMYLESTGCVPICYGLLKNEEDGYGIVMEYVGSGQTLYDIMCESDMPRLIWLNIVCQLASGLNKIHKKRVLINDIKSDNILVDMSGTLLVVKFCDMGTASYKSGVHYKGAMEGCVHLAPEACAHAETTPACDVFSLGRVLKKIHGVSHISALLAVSDMCMAENPAERPTLSTVVQRLQDEYTKEVLFPTLTLTVPSHGYLESSDEESEEESTGHVGVNTPINVDTSSSLEVNESAQDGNPSPINSADANISKSAQDRIPGRIDKVDDSKCPQDESPSPMNNTDAATSKPTQDGSPSLDATSTGHKTEISTAFHAPNKSPCFYTPAARTLSLCTPATASSWTASHFHSSSASLELFSAANSPKVSSATETPDSASSELQTSPSHSLVALSEICFETAEDYPVASVDRWIDAAHNGEDVVPVAAEGDESPSISDLDTSHLAAYHVLCQKQLDVYNKHCEDTPVYEDYLPLFLPLLMLPLGLLGFI